MATLNGLEETLYLHQDSYDGNSSNSSEIEHLTSRAGQHSFSSAGSSQVEDVSAGQKGILGGADWLSWGSRFRMITSDRNQNKLKKRRRKKNPGRMRPTFRIGNGSKNSNPRMESNSARTDHFHISSRSTQQYSLSTSKQEKQYYDHSFVQDGKNVNLSHQRSLENDSVEAHESKYPEKKKICYARTPTLTASLSSSMSNNSRQPGHTLLLDSNAFDDVQHWNVNDGPFEISISPSCTFFKEEDEHENYDQHEVPPPSTTPPLSFIDHETSSKVREILLESDDESIGSSSYEFGVEDTKPFSDGYIRIRKETSSDDSGDSESDAPLGMSVRESIHKTYEETKEPQKMDFFGLELPVLGGENMKNADDSKPCLPLKYDGKPSEHTPFSFPSSHVTMDGFHDDDSEKITNDEIKLESKKSNLSELSLTPILQKNRYNPTKTHPYQSHTQPSAISYNDDYPLSPGMHRRVGVHDHIDRNDHINLSEKKAMSIPMPSFVNNRSRGLSYSKVDRRPILRRGFNISFWIWSFLISTAFIVSISTSLSYSSPGMSEGIDSSITSYIFDGTIMGGGLRNGQSNPKESLNFLHFQNVPTIVSKGINEEQTYSILLANQRNSPILPDAIVETIDYLETCANVKNIFVSLDDAATESIWPNTEKLDRIQVLSQDFKNTYFSSILETTAVLLLDEIWGIYSCSDMDQAFQVWKQNTSRIVGFEGLHLTLSDKAKRMDSSLVTNGKGEGNYNLVSTSAAFVHRNYIQALDQKELYSCQGMGLSAFISANSKLPPIQMKGKTLDFGWDRLLVDSRNRLEQTMLREGKHCVEELVRSVGTENLPSEDFVYIGKI